MRSKLQRGIAFFIAVLFFVSICPVEILWANKQSAVSDLSITNLTGNSDPYYTVRLSWTKPTASQEKDPLAIELDQSVLHDPEGYEVFYRNTTTNQSYLTTPQQTVPASGNTLSVELSNLSLEKGSLYSFLVRPYHNHLYPGETMNVQRRAPMDTLGAPQKEVLYMTDIDVFAKGSGNTMTVQWQNPLLNGKEIFTGYRIYYAAGGTEIGQLPSDPHVDVLMSDKSLIRKANGTLEYTFAAENLQLGALYAVKVEPLMNTTLVRNLPRILVGDKTYDIAYAAPSREYRTNEAYIKPALHLKEEGLDYVRLFWNSFSNTIYNIQRIELFKSNTSDFLNQQSVGILEGENSARYTNYWLTNKPKEKTYYKIVVSYKDNDGTLITMESEYVVYDPSYASFAPYRPNVLEIKDNAKLPLSLDLLFEAFLRKPINDDERLRVDPDTGKYLDQEMNYTIWITDDIDNFDNPQFYGYPIETINANTLTTKPYGEGKVAYQFSTGTYARKLAAGGFEKVPLEDNKIYYVRIQGARVPNGEVSEFAYGSHYVMPITEINKQPITISKPPLRIKEDAKGVKEITKNSINIQWDQKWFEAYDATRNIWEPRVGIDDNGQLVFGKEVEAITDLTRVFNLNDPKYQLGMTLAEGIARIKGELQNKTTDPVALDAIAQLPLRLQDLKNANYEIHVVDYEGMEAEGGYDAYLKKILDVTNDASWKGITPQGETDHPTYLVDGLNPNTSYVIFFRPYQTDTQGKKVAYYPNFIVGTTLTDRSPLDVVPTVPMIEAVRKTDTTVTVRFEYNESLGYELSIGEKLSDYPDGGAVVGFEDIALKGTLESVNGKQYLYYTFDNLFPDTQYYMWVRSFSENTNGRLYSKWSNPVQMKTDDILPPEAPKGLGLASKDSVSILNREANTTLKPSGSDYFIVEWMKNQKDLTEPAEGGGEAGTGKLAWLQSKNIFNSLLVKYGDLIANRAYYVRAKTRLVIHRGEGNKIEQQYAYIVQFSTTPDFTDVDEIIVPPMEAVPVNDANTKVKDSEWSKTVKLYTNMSGDEYDGDKNPNFYPLPEDDFEIRYDTSANTMTYRLRSMGVDADGVKDNLADQRFISKLVKDGVFEYGVDFGTVDTKNMQNKTLEMPYSIYKALQERKINLTLQTKTFGVTIPYGALATPELNNIKDFGLGSNVKVTLTRSPAGLPSLYAYGGNLKENYASEPYNVKVEIVTKSKTTALTQFEKPVTIGAKLDHRFDTVTNNIQLYYADGNAAGWAPLPTTYDNVQAVMTTETRKIANFGLISKAPPAMSQGSPNSEAVYRITNKINIQDLAVFQEGAPVQGTQFHNLVWAVAKDNTTVTMNKNISADMRDSLVKAKLWVSSDPVTMEQAVDSLVRLYEIKTKESIKDGIADVDLSRITNLDAQYNTSMRKAIAVGLLDGKAMDAKGTLKFGTFFEMLDQMM